jgi:hypothetical protein
MGEYGYYHAHSNMRAFYDMLMRSWAILGFNGFIVCSKHSIGGVGCN